MKRFFLVNLLVAGAVLLLLRLLFASYPQLSVENGVLENLQAAFLAVGIVGLAAGSPWWRARDDAGIALVLGSGLLTVLLRELDIERLPVPALLILLGSGSGRNLLLGLLWATVMAWAVRRRARLAGWLREALASPWGWRLLLGAGAYLLAAAFDQKAVPLAKAERLFWEEAVETLAVGWLSLGVLSWTLAARLRQRLS